MHTTKDTQFHKATGQVAASVRILVTRHNEVPFQNIGIQRPRLYEIDGILENPSVPRS